MSKTRTLRVTEFKGLNKSTNPHNVDDKEFVEMENLLLTKNRGIVSRKGYTEIGDLANTNYVRTLGTTAWSKNDERLYYLTANTFGKMVDGTATTINALSGSGPAKMLRYKDKMLLLAAESSSTGGYLKWFDEDENVESVQYPNFEYNEYEISSGLSVAGTDANENILREGYVYEYAIACIMGSDFKDGITPLSSYDRTSATTPAATIATATQHITGDMVFRADLHGFDITMLNLYRREIEVGDGNRVLGSWVLIDSVELTKVANGSTIEYHKVATDASTGVITNLSDNSYYNSTLDSATLALEITDTGSAAYVDETNYEAAEVFSPKAKYMARLHNRIFLANISSPSESDRKRVYYSYRGLNIITGKGEIEGVPYPNPMLIFPYTNWFDCDAEDVEDEITGIETFENNVVVFTQRCMFIWREGMMEPMKISNDVGCVAWDTIKEFEGGLIWLAHNGVYHFSGSKLTNLTYEKMKPYIDDMRMTYVYNASACIFDRKYFLAAPFESTLSDLIIVYDFDLKTWHVRRYKAPDESQLYTDCLFVDYTGSDATLYFAGKDSGADCFIGQMEDGYLDSTLSISCPFKTKYYDFGAPEIDKMPRVWYIDSENYHGSMSNSVYIDNLNEAKLTFTHSNNVNGFIVNSDEGLGVVNEDYIINLSDELLVFSLSRGLVGSRIQFEATLVAHAAELRIHMIGFEWLERGKLKRKYGA